MNKQKKIGILLSVFGSLEVVINSLLATSSFGFRQDLVSGLGLSFPTFWVVCSLLPVAGLLVASGKVWTKEKSELCSLAVAQEPVMPEHLISRGKELKVLQKRLKRKNIVLIGGEKSSGKSLLAAEYYDKMKGYYKERYWIGAQKSIEESFLRFGEEQILVGNEQKLPEKKRLERIFDKFAKLENSLLVVDNLNDARQMKICLSWLERCNNLQVLITTRLPEFPNVEYFQLESPKLRACLKLFKKHCSKCKPKKMLKEVVENLGNNVFLVQLLAKNLQHNRKRDSEYTLSNMVEDLHNGLLTLGKSKKVATKNNAGSDKLQVRQLEELVMAVYDGMDLAEQEKTLLSVFVVLPSENIAWQFLERSYGDEGVEKHLMSLTKKGLLNWDEKRKIVSVCSLVAEAVAHLHRDRTFDDCKPMLEQISQQLFGKEILSAKKARYSQLLLRYTSSVMKELDGQGKEIAVLHGALGNYYKNVGDLSSSLPSYGKACLIFEDLCKGSTSNQDLKYNLAVSYYKLGAIHKELENAVKALKCFELNTKLNKELYDAYPQNSSVQSNLAYSFDLLGLMHKELDNMQKAQVCYGNCLKLVEELCRTLPQESSFKKRLIKSYENLGDIHKTRKNFNQALECFEKGTRQALKVCEEFAKDVSAKKDLVQLFSKLGLLQMSLNRVDLAVRCFSRENALYRQMHKKNPKELFWKQGLAVSYEKLGTMQSKLGELDKAQKSFEQEVSLFTQLCKSFPQDANLENGLAVSYAKFATFYRAKRKDTRQARHYFGKAKSLWGNLVGQFPQNQLFSKFLSNVERDLHRLR